MDIYDKAKSINGQQDFINFLNELRNNLSDKESEWENFTLESFLEGMLGYCSDKDFDNFSWRDLAEILLASRVYE